MASDDTKSGIAADIRHVYGPRPVGALVPRLARAAFRRHSAASARIMADWADIIGPALAPFTAPRRLAAGTLTLGCAGPLAIELQHLAPEIIARINTHLGGAAVQRIRFVQDVSPPPPPVPPFHVPAEASQQAEHAVAGLPEGELRDALTALGRVVIASRTRPL